MKEFQTKEVLRIARKVIKSRSDICDNCLGRQLAQISTGMTNSQRGSLLRKLLKLRNVKSKCPVCSNLFQELEIFSKKAANNIKGIEFFTFSLGTRINHDIIKKEESLWEEVGIKHCEPIKSELNRELGKLIEKKIKKQVDEKNPDVLLLFNLETREIEVNINPVFFLGKYKKLVRGIPQTKWDKYKVTVEDIIAAPFMRESGGAAHSLHCAGREDIDARCLDWRPFVIEITSPKKRSFNLKKITSEINKSKKVRVSLLKVSNKKEVRRIKEMRPDKTYRVVVRFENTLKGIESLKKLLGYINQQTPKRVVHRRADKLRKRRVKDIKWKKTGKKKAEFEIKGEAGLYIKELVTGDNGRTRPSISEILKNKAKVESLDVIKIHL